MQNILTLSFQNEMKVGVQISYVYAPLVMQCYTNAKIVETMEA